MCSKMCNYISVKPCFHNIKCKYKGTSATTVSTQTIRSNVPGLIKISMCRYAWQIANFNGIVSLSGCFPYINIVQTILSFSSLQPPTYRRKDGHLFHHSLLLFIRSSCLPQHLNVSHCKHSQALRLFTDVKKRGTLLFVRRSIRFFFSLANDKLLDI